MKLNRSAYEDLIKGDLDWLMEQPESLERRHIAEIVGASPEHEYGGRVKELETALRLALTARDFLHAPTCQGDPSYNVPDGPSICYACRADLVTLRKLHKALEGK